MAKLRLSLFLSTSLPCSMALSSLAFTGIADAATINSINVVPADATVVTGQRQPFSAIGMQDNGLTVVLDSPAVAVAGSGDHTCALLAAGTVECWGENNYDQLANGTRIDSGHPVEIPGITGATAIAAGGFVSCAILGDGTVTCWGEGLCISTCVGLGAPRAVTGLAGTVTDITVGSDHACALLSNGSVQCWGNNRYGQLGNGTTDPSDAPFAAMTVAGVSDAVAIAAGPDHTCALLQGGGGMCWGQNGFGQLGDGSYSDFSAPVTVNGLSDATGVAAGLFQSCAIEGPQAEVQCWGPNLTAPIQGIQHAASISIGEKFECVILVDGSISCWGDNFFGQLGNGTTASSQTPVAVKELTDTAVSIAAGQNHVCAALSDGTVKCWGDNTYGQLGLGTVAISPMPLPVTSLTSVKSIAAGGAACAALDDGSAQCWGNNYEGQVGVGNTDWVATPTTVTGVSGVARIDASVNHSCALLEGGTIQCWGSNAYGELGDGNTTDSAQPVPVSGIASATGITAGGDHHTCALLQDRTVWCWGANESGELGDGTTTGSSTPVTVSGISSAVAVAAGGQHTCVVLADGTVRCWGANDIGQLGDGTTNASSTPVVVGGLANVVTISVGSVHSCALVADGTVECWGSNGDSQLGTAIQQQSSDPTIVYGGPILDSAVPVPVYGITTAMAITSEGDNNCAVLADRTIQCWGNNNHGQLGDGNTYQEFYPVTVTGIDSAAAAAVGAGFTCALLIDKTMQCWGWDYDGSLGDGYVPKSTTPLSVIVNHNGITWSGSSPAVATVNNSGMAAGLAPGTTVITASLGGISATGLLTVAQPEPTVDLFISSLTVAPAPAAPGQSISVTATISNAGAAAADNVAVDFYKGTDAPPSLGQSGDVSCIITVLAGASTNCTVHLSYAAAGTYKLWVQVDSTDTVMESNEGNNIKGPYEVSVIPTYTLTLSKNGTGSGIVSGGGTYQYGQAPSVTATADPDSTFAGWTGPNATECTSGSVLMDSDKACTATFTIHTYTVTLNMDGSGSGSVMGAGTYNYSSLVTISATADSGSRFSGWSGPDASLCAVGNIEMTRDFSCTATFVHISTPADLTISNLTVSPSTAIVGQDVTVTATVTNGGETAATGFQVNIYKNLPSSPVATQASSITCTLNNLSAGASTACSGTVTYDTPGTALVWAQADTMNVVSESNKANNLAGPELVNLIATNTTPVDSPGNQVSGGSGGGNGGNPSSSSSTAGYSGSGSCDPVTLLLMVVLSCLLRKWRVDSNLF